MKLNNKGNWSLVGLLAAAAIVIIAAGLYFNGNFTSVSEKSNLLDKSSEKQTTVGKAIDTAKGTDCRERLSQTRSAIAMFKNSGETETSPPDLKSLEMGVSPDYFLCPVSGQAYKYDPAAGEVSCSYPSHSSF